jgi:thioredoxin-like negative regulator of GroEL
MIGLAVAALLAGGTTHGIQWQRNFEEALKKAKAANKPVMVDFWAEWCGWCHRLDQTTYVDPIVVKLAQDFVAVKVDTEGSRRDVDVAARYDVSSLPTIAFLSPGGRQILRLNGFQGPGEFPRTMKQAKDLAGKVLAWEAALDRDPGDAKALAGLGVHLFEQEFYEESRELLDRAKSADRNRPVDDRKQVRMLLGIIQNYDRKFPQAESVLKDALALKPASHYDPKLLFVLGRTYVAWGRIAEARTVLREVLDVHGQSPVAQKARETLLTLDRRK